MLRLAKMYLHGQGCARSVGLAEEWVRKARYLGAGASLEELYATDVSSRGGAWGAAGVCTGAARLLFAHHGACPTVLQPHPRTQDPDPRAKLQRLVALEERRRAARRAAGAAAAGSVGKLAAAGT